VGLYSSYQLLHGRGGWYWVLGFIGVPLSLLFANPMSAPRYWMATVAGGYLLVVIFRFFPALARYVGVGLALVYTFVFPFMDYFRNTYVENQMTQGSYYAIEENIVTNLQEGDYDALQQLMNGRRLADQIGPQYGRQLLGTVFFWIPRDWWNTKPIPTADLVASGSGYYFTNLSAPLWLEGYMDFSVVGVFLLLFIYGAFVATVEQNVGAFRATSIPAYCAFVPYSVFLVRGSLMSTVAYILPFLVFAAFSTFVAHRRIVGRVQR